MIKKPVVDFFARAEFDDQLIHIKTSEYRLAGQRLHTADPFSACQEAHFKPARPRNQQGLEGLQQTAYRRVRSLCAFCKERKAAIAAAEDIHDQTRFTVWIMMQHKGGRLRNTPFLDSIHIGARYFVKDFTGGRGVKKMDRSSPVYSNQQHSPVRAGYTGLLEMQISRRSGKRIVLLGCCRR